MKHFLWQTRCLVLGLQKWVKQVLILPSWSIQSRREAGKSKHIMVNYKDIKCFRVVEGRTGLKGRGEKRMHKYRFSKKLEPSGVSQSVSNTLSPPGSQIASGMEAWFFVVVVTSLPSAWDFLTVIGVPGSNPELLGTLCQDSVVTVTSQGNSRGKRTPVKIKKCWIKFMTREPLLNTGWLEGQSISAGLRVWSMINAAG